MNEQLVFPENAAVSVGEHVQLPAAHEEKLAERMLVVLRFIAFGKLKKMHVGEPRHEDNVFRRF